MTEKKQELQKKDRDSSGVRDKYERVGEMILSFIGVGYGMAGGYYDLLSGRESIAIIIISFILYQSTSLAEIAVRFLEVFMDGKG